MLCLETRKLRDRIAYYELPAEGDGSLSFQGVRKDRFCFYVSGNYSYPVWRALSSAVEICADKTAR